MRKSRKSSKLSALSRQLNRGLEKLECRMLLAGDLIQPKYDAALVESLSASHYYVVDGEKIELAIHPDRVAVNFANNVNPVPIVGTSQALRKVGGEFDIYGGIGLGAEESRNLIASATGVEMVYPVFLNLQSGTEMVVLDEVIVALKPGVTAASYFTGNANFSSYRPLMGTPDQFVGTVANGGGERALEVSLEASKDPRVAWSNPNFYQNWQKHFTPNDPRFTNQWHLENTGQGGGLVDADSDLPTAWDLRQGAASNTVIGVIDDGIEAHPDLNRWVNPGEIAGNSIDDDGNGWVDDINGWNFVANNNQSGTTTASDAHGVAVAGVAGAIGNNALGVAGAAYGARMMSAKMFEGNAVASDANIAAALYYTSGRTANGLGTWSSAQVVNNSWGGGGVSAAINSALAWGTTAGNAGNGAVILFSSGNGFSSFVSYPASQAATTPGMLAIGATNNLGTRSDYSNYGTALDLVTPSNDTRPGYLAIDTTDRVGANGYAAGDYTGTGAATGFGGTSSAAPLASGITALVMARAQDLSYTFNASQMRDYLRNNTDIAGGVTYDPATGKNLEFGFGRLNAGSAVANVGNAEISVISSTAELVSGVGSLNFGAMFVGESSEILLRVRNQGTSPLQLNSIAVSDSNFQVVNFVPSTLGLGGATTLRIRFTPVATGTFSGSITLNSNDTNEGAFTIGVTGTASFADVSGRVFEDFDGDATADPYESLRSGHTVFVDANANGNFDLLTQTFNQTVPVNILDNATVNSPLIVSGVAGSIFDVDVRVRITHTWNSDMTIQLVSPAGTVVTLAAEIGGSSDNFTNTIFSDEAATSITSGTAPFTGTFRPQGLLSAVDGQNPNGTWQLRVNDNAAGDVGVIQDWSLIVTTSEFFTLTDAVGYYRFASLPDGTHTIHSQTPSGWTATSSASQIITLGPSDHFENVNYGLAKNDRAYLHLYHDYDRDGNVDSVEPGLDGRQVFIDTDLDGLLDGGVTNLVNTTDVTIADVATSTSTIVASGLAAPIYDVNVRVNLQHTFTADLDVFLVAPDGTRVELFTDVGGSGQNFINTILDDEAASSIAAGSAPFTGTFRPEGLLSALDGKSPNGTWTLEITDDEGGDVGILSEWELIISHGEVSRVTDSNGNVQVDLPAGTHRLQVLNPSGWNFTLPATGNIDAVAAGAPIFETNLGILEQSNRVVSMSSTTIAENVGANSTVGALSIAPAGAFTYSYSLVAGTGDTDNGSFTLSGTNLVLTADPNFEAQSSYSVRVRATNDTLGSYDEQTFVISVADQPEGTALKDLFTAIYTPTELQVTISTNNGPATSLGSFPLTAPLTFYGLGSDDTLRIVGDVGSDTFQASSAGLSINGLTLIGNSIETRVLAGAAGNDTYRFDTDTPLGTYTLDESGGGIDTLDFSMTSTQAITISLAVSTIQAINPNLSLIMTSATSRFENVIGGDMNDVLTGNSLANQITGGLGNDTMTGGSGNDTYWFDADTAIGSDTVSDASGIDTLNFGATTTVGINLDLLNTGAQVLNGNHTLSFGSSIIEGVVGTQMADVIVGNNAANFLTGGGGDDSLAGGSGNDTYLFAADSSLGTDTITDSVGVDTLDFSSTLSTGVTVDLTNTGSQTVNSNLSLVIPSASTFDNLVGSQADDSLTGNVGANRLTGLGGNDLLMGGAGNDTYWFTSNAPSGSDSINDSAGTADVLDFSLSVVGVTVDMSLAVPQAVTANLMLNFGATAQIENLTGSPFDDSLAGNSLNNRLIGGVGNDALAGGFGNDTFVYDTDTILHGNDTIDDASGTDLLDFSLTTTRTINVDIGNTSTQVVNSNLSLTIVNATAFENVTGGSLNDTIVGNNNANVLVGRAGDDSLAGGAGDDVYLYDADLAAGNDTLDESGGGFDTIDFTGTTTTGVTLDLSNAASQSVAATLSLTLGSSTAFEKVIGSSQNDIIVGNSASNLLLGGAGADNLSGGDGNDVLIGGTGTDILNGGNDSDLLMVGTTNYDANAAALLQIVGEWSSANSYTDRVNNLKTGFGGLPIVVKTTTVKKDTGGNTLTGGAGDDWFFANVVGGTDTTDVGGGELLEDL